MLALYEILLGVVEKLFVQIGNHGTRQQFLKSSLHFVLEAILY